LQSATTPQTLVGKLVDAEDGWMLGYAEVKLIDWQGNTVGSAVRTVYTNQGGVTDCDTVPPSGNPPTNIPKMTSSGGGICGDFVFTNVTPGTYTLSINGKTGPGGSWDAGNQSYNDLLQENVAIASPNDRPYLLLRGNGGNNTLLYDPITHAFKNGPALGITPSGSGAHAFFIPSGVYANKYMIIEGDSNVTRIYSPIDNSVFAGTNLSATANVGSFTLALTSGTHAGKFMIVHGGANTATLYNPADNTMTAAGITLPAGNFGNGALGFAITSGPESGKFFIVRGGNSNAVYLYDPATHTYSTPTYTLPANAGAGAFAYSIASGTHAGKTLIVLGNNTMNTALYDPATNTLAAGPGLSANAGAGAHAIPIESGSESGNLLVVHGNNVNTTSLYTMSSGLFSAGPGLPAAANTGSFSIPIRSGPQAGKYLTVRANGSNQTFLFDPNASPFSSAFSSSLTTPFGNVAGGALAFKIEPISGGRLPIVRTLVGQDLKVLLAWGNQNPRDLDLHVVGTLPAGQTHTNLDDNCVNTEFHVNWRRSAGNWQQQYSAKTRTFIQPDPLYYGQQFFPLHPDTTTALVQDTTTGFGPEMINFIGGYTNGTYWFTVVNWSQWIPNAGKGDTKENQQWDVTDIQLRVYDADGLAFQMTAAAPSVTPDSIGTPDGLCTSATDWQQCDLWRAFKMTISGSGPAGRIYTPVNQYVSWRNSTEGGSNTYDYSKCNLNGF